MGGANFFGAAAPTPAFGAPATPTFGTPPAGGFGAPAATPFGAAAAPSGFGAPAAGTPPFRFPDGGAAAPAAAAGAGAGAGAEDGPHVNTGRVYNQHTETTINHGKNEQLIFIGITAMPQFRDRSFDELRMADLGIMSGDNEAAAAAAAAAAKAAQEEKEVAEKAAAEAKKPLPPWRIVRRDGEDRLLVKYVPPPKPGAQAASSSSSSSSSSFALGSQPKKGNRPRLASVGAASGNSKLDHLALQGCSVWMTYDELHTILGEEGIGTSLSKINRASFLGMRCLHL